MGVDPPVSLWSRRHRPSTPLHLTATPGFKTVPFHRAASHPCLTSPDPSLRWIQAKEDPSDPLNAHYETAWATISRCDDSPAPRRRPNKRLCSDTKLFNRGAKSSILPRRSDFRNLNTSS